MLKICLYVCGALLIMITITMIVFALHWRSGTYLTRNCLVINDIPIDELRKNISSMIVVTNKLFPLVSTLYTSHWSLICQTEDGYYNITTARCMSVSITKVKRMSPYEFKEDRWGYILSYHKEYIPNKEVSLYDISHKLLKTYCAKGNKSTYSLINHNCQQMTTFIIKNYTDAANDDIYTKEVNGSTLLKKSIRDMFSGPRENMIFSDKNT